MEKEKERGGRGAVAVLAAIFIVSFKEAGQKDNWRLAGAHTHSRERLCHADKSFAVIEVNSIN